MADYEDKGSQIRITNLTIWEVYEILEAQVIDILQPDVGHGGGITQVKKVAALAEAHHVPIAPHCTMSYIGLTASFHLSASVPFFPTHKGYESNLPACTQDVGDGR